MKFANQQQPFLKLIPDRDSLSCLFPWLRLPCCNCYMPLRRSSRLLSNPYLWETVYGLDHSHHRPRITYYNITFSTYRYFAE